MASNNEQFYKRLATLSGIAPVNESKNETNTKTLIEFERANNGTVYGIVKENHHYFIKKALVTEGDVSVTDFTYIDGIENKGEYQYNSLAEAEKQRNFYLRGINEAWDQGGVYFVNETKKTETPTLDTDEGFQSLVKRTIAEGKKNIIEGREKKFKATLPENQKHEDAKRGLMPEAADLAVKKALGILSEDAPFTEKTKSEGDEVTADSEIKDGDIMPDKTGKEAPQAPINDSNAKAKAEKATGKSKKDANTKPDAGDSIAVNQADKVLKEEVSPLVTDDSEINAADSVADKVNQKHEPSQAPINDTNAKAEADKATGSGGASAAIQNNVDEQPESNPFDDKENAGDETGDIVTGEKNITEDADKGDPFDEKPKGEKDIVAQDSDQADGDRVDNKTSHEKADADYNNHNQPEKGQKEEKGKELKAIPEKGAIVTEAESLIVKDSEENPKDSVANKTTTNLPKKTGKSEIVADSDMNPKETVANKTTTNLPDAIAEGEDQPFDTKTKAGDEKGDIVAEDYDSAWNTNFDDLDDDEDDDFDIKDIENADAKKAAEKDINEGDDLITKDSKINPKDSPANNDDQTNVDYDKGTLPKGSSFSMDAGAKIAEDEETDEKLDAAANALDDLDIATDSEEDAEEVAPEVDAEIAPEEGGEEMDLDMDLGAEGGDEMEMDAEVGGDEMEMDAEVGEEGDGSDLDKNEILKLNSKLNQKISTTDLEPDFAQGLLKANVSAFKDKLGDMDLDDRREIADKILKPEKADFDSDTNSDMGMEDTEEVDIDVEEPIGDFDSIEASIGDEEVVEEDTPMLVDDEPVIDGEIPTPDSEGGECPFASYAKSRGYSKDNMAECSESEMANIVSGYATERGDTLEESDYQEIGGYINDNIAVELEEYGHGELASNVKPFISEVTFGVSEPTMDGMGLNDDEDIEDVPEDDVEMELDGPSGEEEITVVDDEPVVDIVAPEEPEEVGFANSIDVMGAGMPRPDNGLGGKTKSVEVDINAGTVKLEVSEGEVKVRKYVKTKLEELAGKRKPTMNESKKSDNLKKLDKLIEQQWKMLGESVKKKSKINESNSDSLNSLKDFWVVLDYMGDQITDEDASNLMDRAKQVLSISDIEKLQNHPNAGNFYTEMSQYNAEMGGLSNY